MTQLPDGPRWKNITLGPAPDLERQLEGRPNPTLVSPADLMQRCPGIKTANTLKVQHKINNVYICIYNVLQSTVKTMGF